MTFAGSLGSICEVPTELQTHLLLMGPPHHGVVRYATDLASILDPRGESSSIEAPTDSRPLHVHVTDRILGSSPEDAADHLDQLAASNPLTVTLHDVPQQSDGTNFARRIAAYRRFAAASRGVVVSSLHEAALLDEHGVCPAAAVSVIPIGARSALPAHERSAPGNGERSRAVFIGGFIYPGKGHLEVIQAAAEAGAAIGAVRPTVIAIGSPSAGHERDVDDLLETAEALGVDFRVTGFLDDADYRQAQLAHGVPVAAHQHVSASRSLLDWGELGRRPLVVDSRYAREMVALRPGTLTLYRPHELALKIERAWRDPASTWLPADTPLTPTLDDAAAAYRAWWRELA